MIKSDFVHPFRISKSFGRSSRTFKSTSNLALKVFCSWDFKVSKKRSVKLQSVNICIQLKVCVNMTLHVKTNLCSREVIIAVKNAIHKHVGIFEYMCAQ